MPHRATDDDEYEDYHIPKGSIVIFNSWFEQHFCCNDITNFIVMIDISYRAMLHNEDEYPDPFAFKPERFLKDGKLNPNIRDPSLMAFGFGRRWQ